MMIIGISGKDECGADAVALHLAQAYRLYYVDLFSLAGCGHTMMAEMLDGELATCESIECADMFDGMLLYHVYGDGGEVPWIQKHDGWFIHVAEKISKAPTDIDVDQDQRTFIVRHATTHDELFAKIDDIILEIQREKSDVA